MKNPRLEIDASPFMTAITPSDVTVYDPPLLGVRVGVAGDVAVDSGGEVLTLTGAVAGEQIPGRFSRVMATNTTATSLAGWTK